ncbi:MAG: hypothetical protein OEY06_13800 [Gammaproteobacteria bacterium]|nr:hypothetical protein [Gammaproteobacteria bacterium]
MTALSNRWTLLIDATYYPLMDLVNDDIHHQRSDLAKNPSARMTGKGNGYDLMAVLRVQLTHQLSAHLGYRRWERWVENQTLTSYLSDGSSSTARLMDLSTHRDGLVAGLAWLF